MPQNVNGPTKRRPTAIALVIFNRPEPTKRVLDAIARAKPQKLYVISDGPRPTKLGEFELVEETRKLVDQISIPNCEIKRNYSDSNMGCRARITSGVDWVFESEEKLILLEDDCLASEAFFEFCVEGLEKYESNHEIYSLSGSNFNNAPADPGFYYSEYALMWGWATWKSRWQKYIGDPEDSTRIIVRKWWKNPIIALYWLNVFRRIRNGTLSSAWDYQWILTHWRNDAKSCRPALNLVQNIGFGADATHTKSENRFLSLKTYTGSENFHKRRMSPTEIHTARTADEKYWAMINIRTLLLLWIPGLPGLLAKVRRAMA